VPVVRPLFSCGTCLAPAQFKRTQLSHLDSTMRGSLPSLVLSVPKQWTRSIQSALVHVMALAQYALAYTRGWAFGSSLVIVTLTFCYSASPSFCNAADSQKLTSDPMVLLGHASPISTLAFLPSGRRLLSSEANKSISLWDLDGKQQSIIVPEQARILSLSVDGTKLVTCIGYSSTIKVWDLATSKEVCVIKVPGKVDVAAGFLSPDAKKLFTLDCNRNRQEAPRVRLWDVESCRQDQMWTIAKLVPPPEPLGAWPFFPHWIYLRTAKA
jgi:WD40 repeat protein